MAHYFVTGHTGFKGSWLICLLKASGHEVSGFALDPLPGSAFERANLEVELACDFRGDIRNRHNVLAAVHDSKPDFVIHLAAQALVRDGYRNPVATYETNVNGTLNVLEAIDSCDSIKGQLIVTTDKVYLNKGRNRPYVESDSLGGKDPYSVSKSMADLLAQEYLGRSSSKPGAIVRAGNVVGSGDTAVDRLIPDSFRAWNAGTLLKVRNSHHIRPWQHVLDCLSGYLLALEASVASSSYDIFNFGPSPDDSLSVSEVVGIISNELPGFHFTFSEQSEEWIEENYLELDSTRARLALGWVPLLDARTAISWALRGASSPHPSDSLRDEIIGQVESYRSLNYTT